MSEIIPFAEYVQFDGGEKKLCICLPVSDNLTEKQIVQLFSATSAIWASFLNPSFMKPSVLKGLRLPLKTTTSSVDVDEFEFRDERDDEEEHNEEEESNESNDEHNESNNDDERNPESNNDDESSDSVVDVYQPTSTTSTSYADVAKKNADVVVEPLAKPVPPLPHPQNNDDCIVKMDIINSDEIGSDEKDNLHRTVTKHVKGLCGMTSVKKIVLKEKYPGDWYCFITFGNAADASHFLNTFNGVKIDFMGEKYETRINKYISRR